MEETIHRQESEFPGEERYEEIGDLVEEVLAIELQQEDPTDPEDTGEIEDQEAAENAKD